MSLPDRYETPGKWTLARAHFEDSQKDPAIVFDVVYRTPGHPLRLSLGGSGITVIESIMGALLPIPGAQARPRQLGLTLSEAILSVLELPAFKALAKKIGLPLTSTDLVELLSPLLGLAYRGQVVIAGQMSPPSPQPQYVPFAPHALTMWRFIPGDDTAIPLIAGAAHFVGVRVFTPVEWGILQAGGKLSGGEMACRTPSALKAPATGRRGRSYRQEDAALVATMKAVIASGQATSPWDAALTVCGDAKGKGTTASKAKRLLSLFQRSECSD